MCDHGQRIDRKLTMNPKKHFFSFLLWPWICWIPFEQYLLFSISHIIQSFFYILRCWKINTFNFLVFHLAIIWDEPICFFLSAGFGVSEPDCIFNIKQNCTPTCVQDFPKNNFIKRSKELIKTMLKCIRTCIQLLLLKSFRKCYSFVPNCRGVK